MNYAGCAGGVGGRFTLWPPNKLKLLKIRHALHEALHCNKSRSATQLPLRMQWQRCRRRCSKRARNFRNFLIAANALHKWESRGEGGGEAGSCSQGSVIKMENKPKTHFTYAARVA